MVVKSVTFYIQREHVNESIDTTLENQRNSLQEKGISVFDFYQGQDDPTRFILYEVYDSDESVESRMKKAHFEKWLAPVTSWFAKPRERVVYVDVAKID